MKKNKFSPTKALLTLGVISSTCAGLLALPTYADGPTQEEMEANFTQCLLTAYNNEQTRDEDKITGFASNLPTRIGQFARIKNVQCYSGGPYALHEMNLLTSLESLTVNSVAGSTIDLSSNTSLKYVTLINDNTSNLEVTLPRNNLEQLFLRAESFKPIDLSGFNKLESISISGDAQITLPTGSALQTLDLYYNNHVQTLDLSANPGLGRLVLYESNIKNLDLTNNQDLIDLQIYNGPDVNIQNPVGQIENLDLTHNTKLESIQIVNQKIKDLDLSKNTKLKALDIRGNKQLKELDLSKNKELVSIDLRNNALETVNLSSVDDEDAYINLSGNDNLTTVITSESWEEDLDEDEIRDILRLDEEQKDTKLEYGSASTDKEEKEKKKVPNTGFGISEMAQYGAIVVLPTILLFAGIAKNAAKVRSKRVRFSR